MIEFLMFYGLGVAGVAMWFFTTCFSVVLKLIDEIPEDAVTEGLTYENGLGYSPLSNHSGADCYF